MQEGFENWECGHREEKIPVGAIFGLVFLSHPPVSVMGDVLVALTHRVIGQFHNN